MKNLTKLNKLDIDKQNQNLIYGYEGGGCNRDEEGCTTISGSERCRDQFASRCNRCECGYD